MIDLSVPWVLLRVRDQLFGIPASNIREMAEMPAITRVPDMPEYVLGLVSLRGHVTPTIDLRRRLGIPSAEDDLRRLTGELEQAEAEHRRLAERLQAAVRDGSAAGFEPGSCPSHRWLETIESKNPLVRLQLKKLEAPHANLHAGVDRVVQAAQAEPASAAAALQRFTEKDLVAFTRLLPQVRERLIHAHRQIVVVLTLDGESLGAAVDEVESIESLKDHSIEELPAHMQGLKSKLTRFVGRRTRDDEIVLILEVAELFHGDGDVPLLGDWIARAETASPSPEPGPASGPGSEPKPQPEPEPARPGDQGEAEGPRGPAPASSNGEGRTAAGGRKPGGRGEHAWCGDLSGPWVRLAEGPILQAGAAWSSDEAESNGRGLTLL